VRRLLVSVLLAAVALAVAVAVAAAPSGAATGAASTSKCQRLKGRDIAPARSFKLVQRPNADDGTDLVGCRLPRGPLRVLATSADFYTTVESYAIKQILGRIVVLETVHSSQYAYSTALTVHDLRSGGAYALGRTCTMIGGSDCGSPDAVVPAWFVTRAGRALALVVSPSQATVIAFSTLGRARPFDVGAPADIPPESLALNGNLGAWTNAGVVRTASLTAG